MKQRAANSFSFIEPMKALRVTALPAGDWVYELKYDGYRALTFKSGSDVRLVSRNRTNFNKAYPHLIDALKSLPAKNAIVDGEIAALDQHGKPSFQLLQAYGKSKETPLIYYAFDLLSLEGKDLRNRPLVERRKLLAKLLGKPADNIRFLEELRGNRDRLYREKGRGTDCRRGVAWLLATPGRYPTHVEVSSSRAVPGCALCHLRKHSQ